MKYKWAVYDGEGGLEVYKTQEEAIKAAEKIIESSLDIYWSDGVDDIIVAKITHISKQVNYVERPDDSELDEDECDSDGHCWGGHDYKCGYVVEEVSDV